MTNKTKKSFYVFLFLYFFIVTTALLQPTVPESLR